MINTEHIRRSLLAVALWVVGVPSMAEFTIELNKLEEATIESNKTTEPKSACRAYLVFENKTDASYTTLKLDLVMFGSDGVISKRLAVEGAPLPAQKTSVKLFEIRDVNCGSIARILLNDVISCRDDTGEYGDCVQRITTRSLGGIEFFK